MVTENLVRRATPCFFINNIDYTEQLLKYIVDLEITDNLEGSLDEVSIKVNNENNKFLSTNWAIPKGTTLKIGIKTLNWNDEFEGESYSDVGIFYIDMRQFSRLSATFKGISAPLNSRDVKNSKIWANISLKNLGKEFADKFNLKFFYKVKEDVTLKNIKQEEEEDFSFLNKIAQEQGVKLKITNDILVLFEEEILTEAPPLLSLSINNVEDFEIKDKSNDIYDAIEVKHFDTKKQKEEKAIITKEELETGKKTTNYKKVYSLKATAKNGDIRHLARKTLENINKREIEVSMKIIGCKELYPGCIITILDAGEFSGNYVVTKINHRFPKFTTSIEMYKVKKSTAENFNKENKKDSSKDKKNNNNPKGKKSKRKGKSK